MTSSRSRIAVVAAVLVLGLLVLAGHLAHLMLVQRELWLQRGAKNRWAFRDVPTRRGSILDRNGVPLVQDEPAFALWLDPPRFLQRHPYGQACALAALLGIEPPGDAQGLVRAVLGLPVAALDAERLGAEDRKRARDLAARMLSAVFPARPGTYSRAVKAARGSVRALLDLVEPAAREGGLAALAARLRSFAELDRRLVQEGSVDLTTRIARAATADREAQKVQVRLARRASFDLVALVAAERELWPGIDWLPSVQRRRALPGRDGLVSLETVIGSVGPYAGPDVTADQVPKPDEADLALVRALAALPPVELGNEDDEDLERVAEEDARRALQRHFHMMGRYGKTGVELACDEDLRGTPGLRMLERDRSVPENRLLASFDVTPGRDLRLTIDARLQNVLETVLDATDVQFRQCGVALVAAETGEVLAFGGRPLSDAEGKLAWTTPALGWEGPGDLGSAAKPFVLLEQLDAMRRGRTCKDPAEFEPCTNHWRRKGQKEIGCEGPHGIGARDPVVSIAKSCNFYFYQAGLGLEKSGLVSAYRRFGIVFAPERPDSITGLAFDLGMRPYPDQLRTEQASIGYGIEVNTLQVARAYAALGTGALPRLTLRADRISAPVRLDVADADLETVRAGMAGCVTYGTARHEALLAELGLLAKTGTAEVIHSTKENNAWLAGLVPRSGGRRLAFAAVCYWTPDHGGECAARIVAQFLKAIRADPTLASEYLAEGRR